MDIHPRRRRFYGGNTTTAWQLDQAATTSPGSGCIHGGSLPMVVDIAQTGLRRHHIVPHATMRIASSQLRCNASDPARMVPTMVTMPVQSAPGSGDAHLHLTSGSTLLLSSTISLTGTPSLNRWRVPPKNLRRRHRPPQSNYSYLNTHCVFPNTN